MGSLFIGLFLVLFNPFLRREKVAVRLLVNNPGESSRQFLKKKHGRLSGYSLAEMAISTSIVAMLAVGGLAVMQKKNDSAQAKETVTKLAKIETALKGYIRTNGFVPCAALPASLESAATFGTSVAYDTSVNPHICNGSSLVNETGAVPVRTLGLSDGYSYDGWGRKFTYRSASSAGNAADFANPQFKGNIAITDAKGMAKTNMDQPAPYNDGAIYVIISYGANGKSAAYLRNSASGPSGASGIESKNTDHSRNLYIQNEKTALFDDIVIYGTAAKFTPQQVMESPVRIDDKICDTAQSMAGSGRDNLNNYVTSATAASIQNASSHADMIYKSASILANLCKNRRIAETIKPDRISGLSLWLDANDKGTLFTGSDCATGGLPANNASIGCWKDKSGNGRNATAGNSPTYNTNILSGNPMLNFNGSTTYLNTDLTFLANSNYTIVVVDMRTGSPVQYSMPVGTGSGSLNTSLHYGYKANSTFSLAQLSNDLDISVPTYVASTPSVSIGVLDTSVGHSVYYYVNGQQYSDTNANKTPLSSALSGVIGRAYAANTGYLGYIGEVLIYKRAISTLETDKLKEYISNKWGINMGVATATCQAGMVFQQTDTNPQGSCQCPAGQSLIRDLRTSNACYQNMVNTTTSQCVTVSTAPIYSTPPSKKGMVLWLDANDCTTLTLAGGSTQTMVSAWADKSGMGNNATQSTGSKQPSYLQGAQNSLPAVRFDGANDSMAAPVNISRTGTGSMPSVTISTVYQMRSGGGGGQALWGQDNWGNDRYVMLNPGLGYNGPSNGAGEKFSARMQQVSTWQVLTASFTYPGTSNAWVNGQSTINNGKGFQEALGNAGDPNITIGNIGVVNTAAYAAKVDIGEMIIYNYALSNKQRATLESYLAQKWGIFIDPPLQQSTTTPNTISGLQLWLDADDTSTLFTGSNCSTGSNPANGASIGCWIDKSGNSKNATQSTAANRPNYITGVQNDNSALAFNGSTDYFQLPDNVIANGNIPYTIFITAMQNATTNLIGYPNGLLNLGVILANNQSLIAKILPGDGIFDSWCSNDISGSQNVSILNPYIFTLRYDTSTGRNDYMNGIQVASSANTNRNGVNNGQGQVGLVYTTQEYLYGNMYEILVYNTTLSTSQRQSVERYLGAKWGINAISGPQLWLDASDTSTVYSSSDCETAKASANGSVGCWKDKSGNAYNAVQATPRNQPSYVYGSANYPVIRFPGGASGLAVSTNLNITAPYSMYIVTEYYGATQGRILQSASPTTNWLLGFRGGQFRYYGGTGWIGSGPDVAGIGNWGIVAGINTGTAASYYKNGVNQTSDSSAVGAPGNIVLGGGAAGVCCSEPSQADVAEVLVYNSVLSSTQNTVINRYLGDKWSITAP